MLLERVVHVGHAQLHQLLLHVDALEETREARREDGVHRVGVVEEDEEGVYFGRLEIAQECGGDGSHALHIAAC